MSARDEREAADPIDVLDCAAHLRLIAADVRAAGDVEVVRFTEDGVAPYMTLSDELWLLAVRLDGSLEPLRDPDAAPEEHA